MYKHKLIESKWQKIWDKTQAFKTTENSNKKFYVLDMFPYPSGSGLHVGHPEGYTATDIVARYKRLKGYDVLHPIGWDAFGLPAEQYALNTGNHPDTFTQKNIQIFKAQLKSLGFSFDYSKEIDTTDPKYYKWTQWIFKKLYQQGLAEIKEVDVNWCPDLGTVLSNEEILTNQKGEKISERGEFPVFKKPMKQWVLKITQYADKLLEGLNEVDFPESLKSLQSSWIGKNIGMNVIFQIKDSQDFLEIFTTRVDTIYGVKYLVIAPKHLLTKSLIAPKYEKDFENFLIKDGALSEREKLINKEKNGLFTGSYAIHPLTGEELPIWTANYVLENFGTGIVMGVPAHDERDFEFATKYNLQITSIIDTEQPLPYLGDGKHINSELINGLNNEKSQKKLQIYLEQHKLGKSHITYKIRDWIFSRQRYWGEPFPILFDENGNVHLIDEVLLLPKMEKIAPSGTGESPLANNKEWLNVEIDGKKFKRETNTMPQWAGSSWYYLAYIMKQEDGTYLDIDSPEAYKKFQKWLPVDLYIGGQEHAVLHLLYARFWHKVLFDTGIVPTSEPFYKIVNQGMILGTDGQKMSKSKGNVINPDQIVNELGADTLRVYEMFMGPLTDTKTWSIESINGIRKWLDRIWNIYQLVLENKILIDASYKDANFDFVWNSTIREVTANIKELKFNIAISKLMVFINALYKMEKISSLQPLIDFAIMLSTFAPHIAEELLEKLNAKQIINQSWPKWDQSKIVLSRATVAIQINGKLRSTIEKDLEESQESIIAKALKIDNIKKHIGTNLIKKTIYVNNKIINFII